MRKRSGVLLLIGLCVAATGTASADDPLPPKADLVVIEDLSSAMFMRLDEIAVLRSRRAELEEAAKRAAALIENAEEAVKLAETAIHDYRTESMPEEIQTANGELKLAQTDLVRAQDRMDWSDKMVKRGSISEAQNLKDRMVLQKSQISLRNASLRLEVLERFKIPKEISKLEEAVKKAKFDTNTSTSEQDRAQRQLVEIDRQLTLANLLPQEKQAIQSLNQAIKLYDEGKPKEGAAKLAEARTAWEASQGQRTAERYSKIKARLRDESKKIRK